VPPALRYMNEALPIVLVPSELRLRLGRRGQCSAQTSHVLVDALAVLVRISSHDLIASVLNRNGHLTGRGNRWTRDRVAAIAIVSIPCYRSDEQHPHSSMNLTDAAAPLEVSPRTPRPAIGCGAMSGDSPFADGGWVVSRDVVQGESAQALKRRIGLGSPRRAVLDSEQHEGLFSTT
jgi:hypothetical protein